MKLETLLLRIESSVAYLTMNRPDRLNAMNDTMIQELKQALGFLSDDDTVRIVVITGEGKGFSSGADMKDRIENVIESKDRLSGARLISNMTDFLELVLLLDNYTKPTIAAINGVCVGGGLELALACDFRIASSKARLGLVESNIGLIPGSGGTVRLAKLIGADKAKELVFTGDMIGGAEAERIRLVTRSYTDDEFTAKVKELAEKMATRPPIVLNLGKFAIDNAMDSNLRSSHMFERLAHNVLRSTNDHREGVEAFKQKRMPKFKGR
ncbi:MAG: enoyl-CoA hydratase/isomerase family protein [Candidatus Binatia bacterium]